MRGPVFFFGAEREGGFFSRLYFMCSHHVLIWFSSGSPSSQVISQDIPNRTSDLSHMIYPKFNSHVYELKTWATGEHQLFLFCNWRGSKGKKLKSAKEIECSEYKKVVLWLFSLSLPFAPIVDTLWYLNTFWIHVMHVWDMLWVSGVCNMSLGMFCGLCLDCWYLVIPKHILGPCYACLRHVIMAIKGMWHVTGACYVPFETFITWENMSAKLAQISGNFI